jgi:FAD/FMN-containing dehydrogenase
MSNRKLVSMRGDTVPESAIRKFQAGVRGQLIEPGDQAYELARRVRNRAIDRHPGLIILCADVSDVLLAVGFAREHELLVAVRGGGHSYAGHSACDDGIVVDLSPMKGIQVNTLARTAHAEAGLTLGEYDHATQVYGLATPLGTVAETGISGLTLGGGLGWLMSKYGLSCDNVLFVELVTADCRTVTASAEENPDLYWGVRGGSGNFGVVTSFQYRLYPVSHVLGGIVWYPVERAAELLRFFRHCLAEAPDELTSYAIFLGDANSSMFGFAVCYCGEIGRGEKLLKPLRSLGYSLSDSIRPMTYLEMQAVLGTYFPPEPPLSFYVKSGFLNELNDAAIEALVERALNPPPTPWMSFVEHFQGAAARADKASSAFPHRVRGFDVETAASWQDRQSAASATMWVRSVAEGLHPYSEGGVYVNRLGDEGEERVRAAYGANYERLVALKNKYDPTNFFRLNQNIKPMGV